MKKIFTTVCVVYQSPRLLLAMKKRGFGAGRWNGYGGKQRDGETIRDAAVREMQEESGTTPLNIEEVGIIKFTFENNQEKLIECHIFSTSEYEGEPKETDEMRPRWYNELNIPYDDMWAADEYWFPYLLRGEKFRAKFHYTTPEENKILSHEIDTVVTLE